jgi:two-component system sensor histidine kinase YesM
LTRDIEGIGLVTVLVVILSLVVALGAFFLIINSVGRLVTRLRRLMAQVEKGNLDVRFQNRGRGEIIQLGQSFNRMVTQLKQVIQDNYEAQIQRQKVEIAALQSRINPHFLYNTLASLQMIALTEGCERVASMSYDLGQLMRYALATEELVSLEQEFENTKHFLALMQERYGERLSVTLSVDADLCQYMVPKLMLQPLVENAIAHGIDSKFGTGYVQVCGTKQHDGMVIEVRDDGVGILPDKLAQLQAMLSYEANILKRSQHIGMGNVQGQIQRLFGREYGITLRSSEASGTQVSIYLPMRRE